MLFDVYPADAEGYKELALMRILLILLYLLCNSSWNCQMLAAEQLLPVQEVDAKWPEAKFMNVQFC